MRQREKEHELRFFERQLAAYVEVADVAARIAVARKMGQVAKDIDRLRELLLGTLAVLSEDEPYKAAALFHHELSQVNRNAETPVPTKLRGAAEKLAAACRRSLKGTFPSIGEIGGVGAVIGDLPPQDEKK